MCPPSLLDVGRVGRVLGELDHDRILVHHWHGSEHFGVAGGAKMFVSVDKVSGSFTATFNAFKRICRDAGFSDAQKRDLFSGTAARVYRL